MNTSYGFNTSKFEAPSPSPNESMRIATERTGDPASRTKSEAADLMCQPSHHHKKQRPPLDHAEGDGEGNSRRVSAEPIAADCECKSHDGTRGMVAAPLDGSHAAVRSLHAWRGGFGVENTSGQKGLDGGGGIPPRKSPSQPSVVLDAEDQQGPGLDAVCPRVAAVHGNELALAPPSHTHQHPTGGLVDHKGDGRDDGGAVSVGGPRAATKVAPGLGGGAATTTARTTSTRGIYSPLTYTSELAGRAAPNATAATAVIVLESSPVNDLKPDGGRQLSSPLAEDYDNEKMVFSDLYKGPRSPLSRLRHSVHAQPQALQAAADVDPDWDADLYSRDKTKQKEAVKRYLAEKVRTDWEFQWPPQQPSHGESASEVSTKPAVDEAALVTASATAAESGPTPPSTTIVNTTTPAATTAYPFPPQDATAPTDHPPPIDEGADSDGTASTYSTVSEDARHFRARAEWSSEFSSEEDDGAIPPPRILQTLSLSAATAAAPLSPRTAIPLLPVPSSPFRFDSPDAVGPQIRASAIARKARARRQARNEREWNPGLACFEARRDAWTSAKTVRVRPPHSKPVDAAGSGAGAAGQQQAASPSSPRRRFWRSSHSSSRANAAGAGAASPGPANPLSPTVSPTAALAETPATAQQQVVVSLTTPPPPPAEAQLAVVDAATASSSHAEAGEAAAASTANRLDNPTTTTTERISSASSENPPPTLLTLATNESHGSAVTSGSDAAGSSRTSNSDQDRHHEHHHHHHDGHHHHHRHHHHPDRTLPVETLLPVPRPLLPRTNPMRAGITPSVYGTLYDKVVVHSVQPACPINLADMTRACVAGWKRDGEWPPRTAAQAMLLAAPTSAAAAAMAHQAQQRLHQAPVASLNGAAAANGVAAARRKKKGKNGAAAAGPASPPIVVAANGVFAPAAAKTDPAAATTTAATATAMPSPGAGSDQQQPYHGSRRLSLVGLLGGSVGHGGAEKKERDPQQPAEGADEHHGDHGSAAKAFRRSLQRVLKIGKTGAELHQQPTSPGAGVGGGDGGGVGDAEAHRRGSAPAA